MKWDNLQYLIIASYITQYFLMIIVWLGCWNQGKILQNC